MKYSAKNIHFFTKLKLVVILIHTFLLGCSKEHQNIDANKSQPEYVKQKYSSIGYCWNIVKNEAVNEIIFSNGDTAITGKFQKCRFRTDSLLYSKIHRSTSIGKKEVFDYHTQIPLKGKITPIIYDKENSFRHIYLNRLPSSQNQYVKNSSGKKIRTGVSISILPKKVTRLHSQFITMSEPDRKDNATTDISFYDIDQGLPISNVRNIFHDSRGHLWIASDVGVMKYDGKLLTVFSKKEGLSGNLVWDIFEDSKGNMWFTTFDGGITKYDGLFFYHLTELEGIPTNRVLSVNEDKHNNMWFSTDGGGLLMIKDDEMRIFSSNEGLSTDYFFSISKDSDGNLWFATNGGSTVTFDGNRFSMLDQKYTGNNSYHYAILNDSKKNLWIGTITGGLYRISNNQVVHFSTDGGFIGNSIRSVCEDKDGNIWVGTTSGLARIRGGTMQTYTQKEGLKGNVITSISFDAKKNVWMGSINGISILNPHSFKQYGLYEISKGLLDDDIRVSSVYSNDDEIWFGTNKGFIQRNEESHIYTRLSEQKTSSRGIRTIVKDKNGLLWLGNDFGLISYDGKNFTSYESLNNSIGIGLGKKYIRTLHSDKKGNLWIGTNGGGISRYNGKNIFSLSNTDGISSDNITVITENTLGHIIIGTNGGGIIIIQNDSLINITEKEGLSSNSIRSIVPDKEHNLLIGTDRNGLCIYDGKSFYTITEDHGLSGNQVYSIINSVNNAFLVATNKGISKIYLKGFDKVDYQNNNEKKILITNYELNSGLIQRDFLSNSVAQDASGNIWWGGNQKITILEKTNRISSRNIQDDISLQQIKLNDSFIDYHNLGDSQQLIDNHSISRFQNLPISPVFNSNVHDITFYFGDRELHRTTDVRYTYMLSGYSRHWSLPSKEQFAVFKNIPSGKYVFLVRKIQSSSILGNIAEYQFTIRPPWWQTIWAFGFYSIAFIGLVQGIVSWRTSFLKKKQESLIRQVEEATEEIRNQKEISDSLLLNILPVSVATELKEKTYYTPRYQSNASVLFTDFQNFTQFSQFVSHEELVEMLHDCFSQFDIISKKYNLEKIKTIGDSFMAVGGLPIENEMHAYETVMAGIEMVEYIEIYKNKLLSKVGRSLELRVGIHSGPVIAGVVGLTKFQYDVWGDTVNTASRIESASEPGKVNISETTFQLIKMHNSLLCHERGRIITKGKGEIAMYFVYRS